MDIANKKFLALMAVIAFVANLIFAPVTYGLFGYYGIVVIVILAIAARHVAIKLLEEEMRKLTRKQKKILEEYKGCRDIDDLPFGVYEHLEEIHNYETLYQDVNRFLWDQYFAGR